MTHPLTTALTAVARGHRSSRSPFAGADVCELAGLALAPGAARPVFEQNVWQLDGLVDAHRMMRAAEKRWDFTTITHPGWRLVAKELVLALLAPTHERVAELPHAHRARLSPRTCHKHLRTLVRWFAWLQDNQVRSLGEVTQIHCDEFLQDAFVKRDLHGQPTEAANTPGSVAARVWVLQLLGVYGDLFTADRYPPGFMPWQGAPANTVAGHRRVGENRTPPVPLPMLQPLLAASLYLVEQVGSHLAVLRTDFQPTNAGGSTPPNLLTNTAIARLTHYLQRQADERCPLQRLPDEVITRRLAEGWDPADPLLPVNTVPLGRHISYGRLRLCHLNQIRPQLEQLVAAVGVEHPLGRNAALVPGADGGDPRPWTLPVSYLQLRALIGVVNTACLVVTAAASGMRTSELLELRVGCRQPPHMVPGGGHRFRLAGKVIKGRQFGGDDDEWVVVAEVDRAVGLAERLAAGQPGDPLFGSLNFYKIYHRLFRPWINGPDGQRLGLAPIPAGLLNLRMLRRTLAQELACRPGGLLAAKIQLKHVSTATAEGYANRPGGSQALFRAEVQDLEDEHHLELTLAAFRDFQAGTMPAGPGARDLIATFRHVEAQLADTDRADPAVLDNDRRIENLLRAQAGTLHVGTANYCWFRDPSKALCLRLAGTNGSDATRPLIGLCDSARCPQATHHPCHRPVWTDQANTFHAFLGNPRVPKGEQSRLRVEHDRVHRVLTAINTRAEQPSCP